MSGVGQPRTRTFSVRLCFASLFEVGRTSETRSPAGEVTLAAVSCQKTLGKAPTDGVMEPDTKTKGGSRPAQQPQQQLLQQENHPTTAALPAGAGPCTTTAPARPVEARANIGAGAKPAAALEQSEKQQQPVGLPAAAAVPAETGGSKVGLPAAPTNAGATPGVVRKEADNPNPSAQVVAKQKGNTTAAPQARTAPAAPAAKSVPGAAQPAKTELRGLVSG